MKNTSPATLTLLAVATLMGGPTAASINAQADGRPQPPSTLQQQNEEILRELRAIRELFEKLSTLPAPSAAPAPPRERTAVVTGLSGFVLGRLDARLTVLEYTDLQCAFCQRFSLSVFDRMKKEWIDTGRVRFVSRDYPIEQIHPHAMTAARAARCAGEQGKYWEVRTALVRKADKLTPELITTTAAAEQLDMKTFASCIAGDRYDAQIRSDYEEGVRIGVTGTPSFLIGRSTADGVNGVLLEGAVTFDQFDAKLREMMGPLAPAK
jgi:protein-disulfide isomerase